MLHEYIQEGDVVTIANDWDRKPIDTKCEGKCKIGNSFETVVDPVCVVKEVNGVKDAFWEFKGKRVTEELINRTYEEGCLTCQDWPDKTELFKWNCTLKVSKYFVLIRLMLSGGEWHSDAS